MKDEDFADGIYWILDAVNYKLGGEYDSSTGIDYRNDVFETFSFWSHCECTCSRERWEWDMDERTMTQMKNYPDVDEHSKEWWDLYQMEHDNVTQGEVRDHDPDCKLEDVGFRHFGSGLEVSWYKRVGRSAESNIGMKTLDWFKIVTECLESVRDDDNRP